MFSQKRKRPSLMPAVALASLSALIAIPALSGARLYAAAPRHVTTLTVQRGDVLWTIAERYTAGGQNVQDTIDAVMAFNGMKSATLTPGQALRIPR